MKHIQRLLIGIIVIAILASAVLPAAPVAQAAAPDEPADARCAPVALGDAPGQNLWQPVAGTPSPARPGAQPAVTPVRFQGYTLDRAGMATLLVTAPMEFTPAAKTSNSKFSSGWPSWWRIKVSTARE
jgi:hypothetical protein